jgi:hypothetical protein
VDAGLKAAALTLAGGYTATALFTAAFAAGARYMPGRIVYSIWFCTTMCRQSLSGGTDVRCPNATYQQSNKGKAKKETSI